MPELQNLAAFLMADGCEFLTGQTIAVDGGANLVQRRIVQRAVQVGRREWARAREAIKAQTEKDKSQRSV